MAVRLKITEEQEVNCHYLPCKIDYSGEAEVSKYFTLCIDEKSETAKCSLRGRPLSGKEVEMPANYVCLVAEETKPSAPEGCKEFHVTKRFDKFTYWNWDKTPSDSDKILRMKEWLDIAQVLHQS